MYTDKIYTIDEIREAVAPAARKYNVKPIWLVGPYANGWQTERSGINLLTGSGSAKDMWDMMNELTDKMGKDVTISMEDCLDASNEVSFDNGSRFRTDLNRVRTILENMVLLYED